MKSGGIIRWLVLSTMLISLLPVTSMAAPVLANYSTLNPGSIVREPAQPFADAEVVLDLLASENSELLTVELEGATGPAGTEFAFEIGNFPASTNVEITWDHGSGDLVTLGTVMTDAAGSSSGTLVAPRSSGGSHEVRFTSGTQSMQRPFVSTPGFRVLTPLVPTGGDVSVELDGYNQYDVILIEMRDRLGDSWRMISFANVNLRPGVEDMTFQVPEWVLPGDHQIQARRPWVGQHTLVDEIEIGDGLAPVTNVSRQRAEPAAKVDFDVRRYPSNAAISISLRNPAGATTSLGTVTTSASGVASGVFSVPATSGGTGYRIIFALNSNPATVFLDAPFEIAPRLSSSTTQIRPGDQFTINLRGFAANDTVRIRWQNRNPSTSASTWGDLILLGTATTSATGSLTNYSITVPSNARPGYMEIGGTLGLTSYAISLVAPMAFGIERNGRVGDLVDFDLYGFPANSQVQITFRGLSGTSVNLGTVETDYRGEASGAFRVPATAGGPGQGITFASVANPTGIVATAPFEVLPRISANVDVTDPGEQIALNLRGFKARETVKILWEVEGDWLEVGAATTSSTGSVSNFPVTVPWTAKSGTVRVEGTIRAYSTVVSLTPRIWPAASITPARSTVGSVVEYELSEVTPDLLLQITWHTPTGFTIDMGTVRTDADQITTGLIEVPAVPGGPGHRITFAPVSHPTQAIASTLFDVAPRITASPEVVSRGQQITVNLRGFAAKETVRLRWKVGTGWVDLGTATTSGTGSLTRHPITVPLNADSGTIRAEGTLSAQTNAVTLNASSTPTEPAVLITPVRTTVNNPITYEISNFPANSTVQITWRRLTGATIEMGTVQTNSSGAATGQIVVPVTPGGPGQQITFKSGGVTKTVLFEVAPRVKVTPSPAARGQTIDISLRGFARLEPIVIRWRLTGSSAWIVLANGSTSGTGSANIKIPVPGSAVDGTYQLRAETASFNQQTNTVLIQGGPNVNLTAEVAVTPEPTAVVTQPAEIDRAALPFEAPVEIAAITDEQQAPDLKRALTDGDQATGWSSTPDQARGDARLTIDLGGPKALRGFAWLTEGGGCGQLTGLDYSLNGETWTAFDPYLQPGPIGEGMRWRYQAATQEARFIRFTFAPQGADQTSIGCLAEVAVWGTSIALEAAPVETLAPTEIPAGVPAENAPVESPVSVDEPIEPTVEPTPEPTEPAETSEE